MDGSRASRVNTCDPMTRLDLLPVDVVQQESHRLHRRHIIAIMGQLVMSHRSNGSTNMDGTGKVMGQNL